MFPLFHVDFTIIIVYVVTLLCTREIERERRSSTLLCSHDRASGELMLMSDTACLRAMAMFSVCVLNVCVSETRGVMVDDDDDDDGTRNQRQHSAQDVSEVADNNTVAGGCLLLHKSVGCDVAFA